MVKVVAVFSPNRRPESRGEDCLQFANARIDSLDHGRGMQLLRLSSVMTSLANRVGIHCLGENLERENIVVAIDDESGKEIGFAEDDTIGIGVADEISLGRRLRQRFARRSKRSEIGDRLMRDHADRDLR